MKGGGLSWTNIQEWLKLVICNQEIGFLFSSRPFKQIFVFFLSFFFSFFFSWHKYKLFIFWLFTTLSFSISFCLVFITAACSYYYIFIWSALSLPGQMMPLQTSSQHFSFIAQCFCTDSSLKCSLVVFFQKYLCMAVLHRMYSEHWSVNELVWNFPWSFAWWGK